MTALTAAAGKLGVGLARLRPRDAIVTLARRPRWPARDASCDCRLLRFAELGTQGDGPQRHEGAVTRQMLVDRVLRGIDPMTGTSADGETGGRHRSPGGASRFTTPQSFIAAEGFVRHTPEYRAARDAALFDPVYRRGYYEVALPIEDVVGRDLLGDVEGVVRIGPRSAAQGVVPMSFEGGLVIARFRIAPDGEPLLITMFPVGRRQ